MLRVFLSRHGQTDWNLERRMQGWTDTSLNQTGREQGRQLAVKLRGIAFDAVYCSGLKRSIETANILAGGAPVMSLPELNERCLGVYEGHCPDLADAAFLEEFRRRCLDPHDCLDTGESYRQHRERVEQALQIIRSNHPAGQALIVGHGGTNQLILQLLLSLPLAEVGAHQDNSQLYVIEVSGDAPPRFWRSLEEFSAERR